MNNETIVPDQLWTILKEDGANILAVIAIVLSVVIYLVSPRHEKVRATLEAFPAIRASFHGLLAQAGMTPDNLDLDAEELVAVLRRYLTQLEYFAVGVNEHAYSLRIVERVSGTLMIRQYQQFLGAYVARRRELRGQRTLYLEYERMMKQLYRVRRVPWVPPHLMTVKPVRPAAEVTPEDPDDQEVE